MSLWSRAFALVAAIIQVALPGVLTIADATSERAAVGSSVATHAESKSTGNCARPHTEDCVLCRHLSTPAQRAPRHVGLAVSTAPSERPREFQRIRGADVAYRLYRSRAPPLA
jgi:hypothetical protein